MNSVGILKSTDDLESLEEREQEPDDIKDDCGKSDSDESSKKISDQNLLPIWKPLPQLLNWIKYFKETFVDKTFRDFWSSPQLFVKI